MPTFVSSLRLTAPEWRESRHPFATVWPRQAPPGDLRRSRSRSRSRPTYVRPSPSQPEAAAACRAFFPRNSNGSCRMQVFQFQFFVCSRTQSPSQPRNRCNQSKDALWQRIMDLSKTPWATEATGSLRTAGQSFFFLRLRLAARVTHDWRGAEDLLIERSCARGRQLSCFLERIAQSEPDAGK